MSNALFVKALGSFLAGEIDWIDDPVQAALLHLESWGVGVSAASNTSPVVVTTSAPHNLNDGDLINVTGVVGNLAANGLFNVVVVSPLEVELVDSVGNGAYVSGGIIIDLSTPQMLDDIPSSAIVATSQALEDKSIVGSTAFADTIRFDDVSGSVVRGVVLFTVGVDPSSSRLICYFDRGTGLPLTPNGYPVQLNWNGQGLFALSQ